MPQQSAAGSLGFTEVWSAKAAEDTYVRDAAYAEIDSRPVAVAAVGAGIAVWDLASGARLTPAPGANVEAGPGTPATVVHVAATDVSGDPVAVTGDTVGRVQAWDLRSGDRLGEPLARFDRRVHTVAAARGAWTGLVLAAMGAGTTSTVYSVPAADEAVHVWDLATKQVRALRHGGYTDSAAVGEHDGRALAVASAMFAHNPLIDTYDARYRAFVWDAATGDQVGGPLEPEQEYDLLGPVAVGSVAGRAVVVGVSSRGLCVWELGTARPTALIEHTGTIEFLAWGGSEDRPLLLAGGGDLRPDGRGWLRVWDPRDWRLLGETELGFGLVTRLAPAPDGQVIVPWGTSIKVLRYAEAR
jgi:WD40 repeat protein